VTNQTDLSVIVVALAVAVADEDHSGHGHVYGHDLLRLSRDYGKLLLDKSGLVILDRGL